MSTPTGSPGIRAYGFDPVHSSVQFSVRHMMISKIKGEFTKVAAAVAIDLEHPEDSRIEAMIDAASIRTRDEQRDAHLKSPDFLNAEKYPEIRFTSRKIERAGKGEFTITGDLTIRDVTRQVVLHVEGPTPEAKDPWGNLRAGATARGKIHRGDFGLTWNQALETGGVLVGDEISIEIDVELVRQAS